MKSSGKVRTFSTGAVRDSGEGKIRLGLLPFDLLQRVAVRYQEGAEKYGQDNWREGQPQDTTLDSLLRHLTAYMLGEEDEDHLAAAAWNVMSLMYVDEYFKDNPELRNVFAMYRRREQEKNHEEKV